VTATVRVVIELPVDDDYADDEAVPLARIVTMHGFSRSGFGLTGRVVDVSIHRQRARPRRLS
jgi:hypothetical protein